MLKKIIGLFLLFYGGYCGYSCYVAFSSGNPDDKLTGVVSLVMAILFIIIGLLLLKKKKEYNDSYDEDYEYDDEEHGSGSNKAFPKFVMTFLVMIVCLGVALGVTYLDKDMAIFNLGSFVYDNVLVFGIIFLIVGIVSSVLLIKFDTYDTTINTVFLSRTKKNITLFNMFFNYFGAAYAQGPLFYSECDQHLKKPRSIHLIFMLLFRGVITMIGFIAAMEIIVLSFDAVRYEELITTSEYMKSNLGMFIILFGANCDIALYTLRKLLPLTESSQYEVTTYYSDGSITKRNETRTNIVSVLILSALLIGYYIAFFWAPIARNIVRLIETKRFNEYCDEYSDVELIDFYG